MGEVVRDEDLLMPLRRPATRKGATELRAATRDPRTTRTHAISQDPGPSTSEGDSASREVSRRRHQVDLGGVGGVKHVVTRND